MRETQFIASLRRKPWLNPTHKIMSGLQPFKQGMNMNLTHPYGMGLK